MKDARPTISIRYVSLVTEVRIRVLVLRPQQGPLAQSLSQLRVVFGLDNTGKQQETSNALELVPTIGRHTVQVDAAEVRESRKLCKERSGSLSVHKEDGPIS